jgi:hypothetical protein
MSKDFGCETIGEPSFFDAHGFGLGVTQLPTADLFGERSSAESIAESGDTTQPAYGFAPRRAGMIRGTVLPATGLVRE